MAAIGHRAGLFDTMSALPPSTSEEIAKKAGLNERYVRASERLLIVPIWAFGSNSFDNGRAWHESRTSFADARRMHFFLSEGRFGSSSALGTPPNVDRLRQQSRRDGPKG